MRKMYFKTVTDLNLQLIRYWKSIH